MEFSFNFSVITNNLDILFWGIVVTMQIAALATAMGLAIGITGAGLKLVGFKPLSILVNIYVEIIRNTPFLVQLFIVFFTLPSFGIKVSPFTSAVVALGIHLGAYAVEIMRAGIEAVHRGQIEAGSSLGLSGLQVFRYVILTPALMKVYPSLTSLFIIILLDTSIVSVIGVEELTYAGKLLQSRTFRDFEIIFALTFAYLCLSFIFRTAFGMIARRVFPQIKV